ncbi:MAG: glycosyltransferase [Jaaginema sp. PMC 1079.18]|nr:glycosyltransferase [Jaaginema sp. PMC 1080.18]MEC4853522.1 glycosyltransferase [Jaaginema sp. PMC 1079.18]MEC4868558.1 glycosyltransferase [Jaaginema sp. PMC 1078.18]
MNPANAYLFFVRDRLPQPGAHLVQIVHLANAAANLGYPAILTDIETSQAALNPLHWLVPFRPHSPSEKLKKYYNLQDRLQVTSLPMPYPVDRIRSKWTNSSTLACKYYLPVHLRPRTRLVHSRDWNFVKAAVKQGIAAIYERDHYENKRYEPEIVNNPLFQVTVTVADTVREDLIHNGMPPEKVIKLHNGFNQLFYTRQPEAAQEWRSRLLKKEGDRLVVYAGELIHFKGIDLLLDIAPNLPQVQFALAGGTPQQIQHYQQQIRDRHLSNVTLLGYLQHHRLASLLQAADALLYPHLSGEAASFTSPMKLFDYIAAGCPIVATQIAPLQEFADSPLVAAWCPPDDPRAFEQALQQVLQNYPTWTADSVSDRDLVQQYSWEHRIQQTLNYVAEQYRPV